MPCYSPLVGYRSSGKNSNGKRPLVFNSKYSLDGIPQQVPCGQCIGCRLERSRQWAVRCVHEASLFRNNCFITLTYDDDHYPLNGSLDKKHFQDFMKRLREKFTGFDSVPVKNQDGETLYVKPIRFFHCGEYGSTTRRPHYHALLFNFDFEDKIFWKKSLDSSLYLSPSLQKLWPFGFSTIGDVTFESAAYVARYIMKKVNGDAAEDHYRDMDCETGEIITLQPEYCTMSRRPGIGRAWFDRYSSDVYPNDFVVINARKLKPPKYYDTLYELDNPEDYERLKLDRKINALKHIDNNSYQRLAVRKQVAVARLNMLKRNVE